ncbi:hypothetical protein D3C84_895990 [compost metagenome]
MGAAQESCGADACFDLPEVSRLASEDDVVDLSHLAASAQAHATNRDDGWERQVLETLHFGNGAVKHASGEVSIAAGEVTDHIGASTEMVAFGHGQKCTRLGFDGLVYGIHQAPKRLVGQQVHRAAAEGSDSQGTIHFEFYGHVHSSTFTFHRASRGRSRCMATGVWLRVISDP